MKKTYIFSILATLLLAIVAIVYFYPDDVEGNVLRQHDIMQGLANGQEGKAFHEATGETTRWTNSLFSGMPNFQIAPSYPANDYLSFVSRALGLWLPAPANLLFVMMAGFFIMCLCFGFKWHVSLFAAVAWGFSSYFMILIGAGHIWKFATLAYIPPTIGGIALCYRGKYLPGLALASLFGALQLQSNHPQMSYYFLFVIFFLVLAWLYNAIRKHTMKRWVIATLCSILAGGFAVAANAPSLYNTLEYSKETVRGKATDLATPGNDNSANAGMSREAITAWSYGIDETLTLLIPNAKGGATIKPVAGENAFLSVDKTPKADEMYIQPEVRAYLGQFPQYFGDQPMTNGPVYVGAFVLLLAILALFTVDGPLKWALFAVSVLAILLSWGHNFAPFTNFFIDHFPGYNRFRAVSSILVIVEFCIPLLAAMCIRKIADTPDYYNRNKWGIFCIMGIGAIICLAGWIAPSSFGSAFSASEVEQLSAAGIFTDPTYAPIINAVRTTRLSLVSADSLRSLIFIILGCAVLLMWFKKVIPGKGAFVCCLVVVTVIDLYPVNKRYVNTENFTEQAPMEAAFKMTDADRAILADTTNYRVMDIAGFSEARSSYFHKTLGGYHAAKLTRYNDLITHQISKGNPAVLNMLNAKYIMSGDQYQLNPEALGNAWIVDSLVYVENANEEMAALDSLRPEKYAVADKIFSKTLGTAMPKSEGDTIYETTYAPNRLTYKARSAKGGLAVFSEIYFPWGWEATVDGKPVEIGRVNYVLRAMRIPAGEHEIVMKFDPQSVRNTNTLAMVSVISILAICAMAIILWLIHLFSMPKNAAGKEKSQKE